MRKANLFFNVLRLPVDFVMVVAAGATAYLLRTTTLTAFRPVLFEFNLPFGRYIILVVAVALLFVVAYAVSGLYSLKSRLGFGQELTKILVASSAGVMAVIVYIFLRQELFNSRFLVLGSWLLAIVFVVVGRVAIRVLRRFVVGQYDIGAQRVVVFGNDSVSESIVRKFQNKRVSGYRLIGHFQDPETGELERALVSGGIDEVILGNPDYPAVKIVELVDFCHEHHIAFRFVPNIYQTLTTNYDIDAIGNIPVIELKRTSLDGWGRVAKRILDVVCSAMALMILLPVFAVIAFAIKWETYGPVFVRLKRVSRSKSFYLLKFRSMISTDADGSAHSLNPYFRSLGNDRPEAGPLWKMKDDPRITAVGRFIRKYRLDELPQFWNVLKGDMSIVGPRPHQSDEISRYQKHHKKVLAIKAGATGLAQVSGSSDLPFEDEVALDTFYIENWSPWLDLRIMLKTGVKMLRDRSAV